MWHCQREEPDKAKLKPGRLDQMLRILGEVAGGGHHRNSNEHVPQNASEDSGNR